MESATIKELKEEMNPRYLIYCQCNGNTPDEQQKKDNEKYHGGKMLGFILFIQHHLQQFKKNNTDSFYGSYLTATGSIKFDEYLNKLTL